MNRFKTSGIAFLCFVSLCSLHGMESNNDSSSESEESVDLQNDKEMTKKLSLIRAFMGREMQVAGGTINYPKYNCSRDPSTLVELYCDKITEVFEMLGKAKDSASIETKGLEAAEKSTDYFWRFSTPVVLQSQYAHFLDNFDVDEDTITELPVLRTAAEKLKEIEYGAAFDRETADACENVLRNVKQRMQDLQKIREHIDSKVSAEGYNRAAIQSVKNNIRDRMCVIIKKNRLELMRAFRRGNPEEIEAAITKPVQLIQLVEDSEKESSDESQNDSESKNEDAHDNGDGPENDSECA